MHVHGDVDEIVVGILSVEHKGSSEVIEPRFGMPGLHTMPREVGIAKSEIVAMAQIILIAEHLVLTTEMDDLLEIAEDVGILLQIAPIEPRYLVVLAIGVVVALLGITHLIARQHHGDALADHQHGDGILHLTVAQADDGSIVGFALATTIPAVVMVFAVSVVLAIGLVMFFVIRDEVHERKAVVSRDEVDTGLDATPLRSVEVGRTDDALLDVAQHLFVALQEAADAVAILSVPLSPSSPRRERAHLIESTCIPCLGNQFGLAENGVVRQ